MIKQKQTPAIQEHHHPNKLFRLSDSIKLHINCNNCIQKTEHKIQVAIKPY